MSSADEEDAAEVDAILSLSQALPHRIAAAEHSSSPTERLLHRLSPNRLIAYASLPLPEAALLAVQLAPSLRPPLSSQKSSGEGASKPLMLRWGFWSALYAFDAEDPDFLARRMIAFLADLDAPVVLESD
ncbi:hypothetical protein Emed_002666 [Eimeria media]